MKVQGGFDGATRGWHISGVRFWRWPILMLWVAVAVAAGSRSAAQSTVVPDFQLRDVNPNSIRHGQDVSPRDYRLQISAYYFGAAG